MKAGAPGPPFKNLYVHPTAKSQLITLRFVYEYSIDEIAGMLAMKSGTVKSQISRTVSKLRLQLVNSQYDTKTESHENR